MPPIINNFFILGRQEGKKKSGQTEDGKSKYKSKDFLTMGFQTRPFAACQADFVPKYFHHFIIP